MGRELPSDWDSRRKKVYKRDDYECQNCGRTGGPRGSAELHAHHNVPRHSGGTHKLSNLTTYCSQCHDAIHYDSHDAPTAVTSRQEEMSVKERVMKYINDPDTHCFECMESWEEGVDYDIQDTFEFLEYDSRPREFVLPSKGRRTGSVAAPYHIRCSNCGTLYGRAENGIATVEFHDEGISDKWYYGIIASVSLFTLFGGVRYLLKFIYGSGYESQIISTGIVFAFFALPVSIYYDIKYLRGSSEMNPHLRNWVQASFIPVVNIFVALLYLKTVRNIEIESETSPVLETCPACGMEYTELSRLFPPDTIDCTMCGSRFKSGKFGLSNQMKLVEGNPDKIGETHTVDEWKDIAQGKSETDSKTNLLATSEEDTEGEQNDRQ